MEDIEHYAEDAYRDAVTDGTIKTKREAEAFKKGFAEAVFYVSQVLQLDKK